MSYFAKMLSSTYGLVLLSLASSILAKTDLAGCTSTKAATGIVYWVPETGELCQILDCGGGRAPPKTDVPGCAAYEGSAPYQPSFMPGWPNVGGTVTAPSAVVPTSGILTDTSLYSSPPAAAASTTLETLPSPTPTSTALSDTTVTLATGSAATSSTPTGLLFDTSAATREVTNTNAITVTSASTGPASATANAAAGSLLGRNMVGALVGAAAGFALI